MVEVMSNGIACTFAGRVSRTPPLTQSSRGVAWCRRDVAVGESLDMQSVGVVAFSMWSRALLPRVPRRRPDSRRRHLAAAALDRTGRHPA